MQVDASWRLGSTCDFVWPRLACTYVDLRWVALTLVGIKFARKSTQVFHHLATQPKSLRKFNLRPLATTCRSVWPGLNSENLHYFGVYTAAMGLPSCACWFLLIKTLLVKNNKKREAALKTWTEACIFFYLAKGLQILGSYQRKNTTRTIMQIRLLGDIIIFARALLSRKAKDLSSILKAE